jgi:lipopolysaccharide/colanic/teichoic acid biosynthesis glycosyltransferase
VSGRCELSFEEMVALDVRYWQRWTLLSDIAILLRTPRTVLSGRGAA